MEALQNNVNYVILDSALKIRKKRKRNMKERKCCRCGAVITACNGFVMASDFLEVLASKREWSEIREHCGRCVIILSKDVLRKGLQ